MVDLGEPDVLERQPAHRLQRLFRSEVSGRHALQQIP
jgi:hypothetical protein